VRKLRSPKIRDGSLLKKMVEGVGMWCLVEKSPNLKLLDGRTLGDMVW